MIAITHLLHMLSGRKTTATAVQHARELLAGKDQVSA